MKKEKSLLFLIATAIIIANAFPVSAATYTLKDAISYGYVKATITGNYVAYGSSAMYMKIENLRSSKISIQVDLGRFLVPRDSSYQRMVISKEETIEVEAKETETLYLGTFCLEFKKEIPTSYVYYDVGSTASSDLMRLLKEIDSRGIQDSRAAQLAIWTVTDGITVKDSGDDKYTAREAQVLLDDVFTPGSRKFDISTPIPTSMRTPTPTPMRTPIPTPKSPAFETAFALIGIVIIFLAIRRAKIK